MAHDAVGRRAGHNLVEHRKWPGSAVAHIAGDARKARLEHQDADPGAVERLAAMGDAGNIVRHHRQLNRKPTRPGSLREPPRPLRRLYCASVREREGSVVRLDHLSLPVADWQKSRDWYRD